MQLIPSIARTRSPVVRVDLPFKFLELSSLIRLKDALKGASGCKCSVPRWDEKGKNAADSAAKSDPGNHNLAPVGFGKLSFP